MRCFALRWSLACFALLALARFAPAQSGAAIDSVDVLGQRDDTFRLIEDVYLAGGQALNPGCKGPGLSDGLYYFQVTNPEGTQLLSTDALIARRVQVLGGVFSSTPAGGHAVRVGACGSKILQLAPFQNSTTTGNEYKVWLTRVENYQLGQGSFGFLPAFSKTDHFKVRSQEMPAQTTISGTLFYDFDEDGVFNPKVAGEVPLSGWKVVIVSPELTMTTYTDADGHYEFLRKLNGQSHTLTSFAPQPGFIPAPGGQWLATNSTTATVIASTATIRVDFGNLHFTNTPEYGHDIDWWIDEGQCVLESVDPAWRVRLNELCLRTKKTSPPHDVEDTLFSLSLTSHFLPAFNKFKQLLKSPEEDVLAHVLSKQFSIAVLNYEFGDLQYPTYIDVLGDGVLVSLDVMIANTTATLCDPRSANTGPNGDPEWLAHIMMCLHEWNGMNSDGTNIFTRSPAPPLIVY